MDSILSIYQIFLRKLHYRYFRLRFKYEFELSNIFDILRKTRKLSCKSREKDRYGLILLNIYVNLNVI